VQDCISAIFTAIENAHARVNIFNLGLDEYCEVNQSIGWICEYLGVKPEIRYTGGERGWIGDSPFIFLDCGRIRGLGWAPELSIREGVIQALRYLHGNGWVFARRIAA
jgi:UDP-glucose 4-epimerase